MAALGDDAADQIARRTASLVDRLARAAFARMWAALQAGGDISPRDAIQAVQVQFGRAFAEALAAAFSELLRRSVGVAEVRSMPVGGLSLSRHLYLHNADTSAQVLHLVRQHAAGVHEARALALRLYDGYTPQDGVVGPLEGRARASLPKALRELTADPAARQTLASLVERGQKQAARLKTRALRAGYTEALDAWAAGAGQAALKRKLEVAQREKNRYFADRIAQTELARAHQAQVAADLMTDDTIDVVQVRINPAHPKADICDLHARADLWGLGPGNYPKARAPRPPFHPHCWCRLRSRPSLSAAGAREVPGGEAAYLRTLAPGEAARVMGSAERARAVMGGRSVQSVVNDGRDPLYRLARVGDGAAHALVGHAGVNRAYEAAKQPGGDHHGLVQREGTRQVEKAPRRAAPRGRSTRG